jgi:import inner membrane translocase subunit TIM21
VFHNNPPSVLRPRHRNRHVSSQIVLDSGGREHMLLNFYIQATSHLSDSQTSYFESLSSWVTSAATNLPELSWQEAKDSAVRHAQETVGSAKDLFRYLSGDPAPSQPAATHVAFPQPLKRESPTDDRKGFWGGIAGLFGSLRSRNRTGSQEGSPEVGHGRVWNEGEVHADLVRVGIH